MKAYGIGRLTKDIEVRMTSSGKKVATFTLACRRTKDITDFISCVAWEKRAELLQAYTHKGSQIFVEGTVTARSYDDTTGRKVYVTEILVDNVTLCDSKPTETRTTQVPVPEQPQTFEGLADYMESNGISHIQNFDDDSLPF